MTVLKLRLNKYNALFQMHAELQVLSPLVPVREVNFLRFCKQHAEGVWAVVDVSIDSVRESSGAPTYANCRRLPSGCVVQDMPNGYSKVINLQHFVLINLDNETARNSRVPRILVL